MMEIKASMLSKDMLVELVNNFIKKYQIKDGLLAELYMYDLAKQINDIRTQLEKIEKVAKGKRLSKKEGNALAEKHYRLSVLGNKKIAKHKELENANSTPESL